MLTLAQRISALRAAKDLTQEGLARASGVTLSTIQRIEAGTTQPSLSTLRGLADGLGVGIGHLLAEASDGEALPASTDTGHPS